MGLMMNFLRVTDFIKTAIAALSLLALATGAQAAGAPKGLYGKSVRVSWSEAREQRPRGEDAWRTVHGTINAIVYISDKGNTFGQSTARTAGGTAVPITSVNGKSDSAPMSLSWQKRSATYIVGAGGGARRVVLTFDESYSSCTLSVTFAKSSPDAIAVEYSTIIKRWNEVKGATVGGMSCSVQQGNLLAGG